MSVSSLKAVLPKIIYKTKCIIKWNKVGQKIWVFTRKRIIKALYYVLSPVAYEQITMAVQLGYWPNLKNPRSLSEKLTHRKLFAMPPLASLTADKWRVREYVRERVGEEILTKVYWVGNNPEQIPFDTLPDEFVVKANHGSGWNIFVRDKKSIDRKAIVQQCQRWLVNRLSNALTYETHLDNVKPLIIVEEYLKDRDYIVPIDYKFYCFHGRVHYVQIVTGRYSPMGVQKALYNREWVHQKDAGSKEWLNPDPIPPPKKLPEMIDIAERLSQGIDFVRVDLYCINNNRIVFGEMTWTQYGGRFSGSREYDFLLGELW